MAKGMDMKGWGVAGLKTTAFFAAMAVAAGSSANRFRHWRRVSDGGDENERRGCKRYSRLYY
jgi:hypothetical protein